MKQSRSTNHLMQAVLIKGPQQLQLVEVEKPVPQKKEVRVRLEGCGVCGSNLPIWEGREWFQYPLEPGRPGHEGWGIVDSIGPEVTTAKAGVRVAFLSDHSFAEYDVVSEDMIVPIPDCLSDKPFPGEPLACAMNVFEKSSICEGEVVAIIGIGFLGALLTMLASKAGARVICISRRPFSLEIAKLCGAKETLSLWSQQAVVQQIHEITKGKGCDCVIEAVGLQQSLDLASDLVREEGRLVIAGFHQDGKRTVDLCKWNWRAVRVVNAHDRNPNSYLQGMRRSVELISKNYIDPTFLYTHSFPLSQAAKALNSMKDRPHDFLKALITL